MEWIKSKYDRLLLGIFGVIALLIGGLLLSKVLGFKGQFPRRADPKEQSDFGTTDALKKLELAKTVLIEPAAIKPPLLNSIPISLFASAPVIKTSTGELIAPLDPKSPPLRPPVENRWLYDNNLDLTRSNIIEIDTDGDFYSNSEEFLATPKTNPRDKTSHPAFWAKVSYVQCIKDPLTLKFAVYLSPTEFTIRRTEPPDKAFNNMLTKVGDSFPAERGGKEPRFKVVKLDSSVPEKEKVFIDDLLTEKVEELEIAKGKPLELPNLRAKLICSLGKEEEKTVSLGETFEFMVNPDFKFYVESITEEEVVLSFTEPGATGKKTQTFKISSPP